MLHRQQQKRQLNFRRDWREYEEGFGDPSGEYWIGAFLEYLPIRNVKNRIVGIDSLFGMEDLDKNWACA
jgi:hypothetical protein